MNIMELSPKIGYSDSHFRASVKSGISAKIVADSRHSLSGTRITTFELEYPRFIHSEFMTHRVFSRNAASSRAIPIMTQIKQVMTRPAMPVHWGKNQSGMQAKSELSGFRLKIARALWRTAGFVAGCIAYAMYKIGLHKQVGNRIIEPFVFMKTVMTSTEFANFFELRDHEDAQPEIWVLAKLMRVCYNSSTPVILQPGDWHLPYYQGGYIRKDDVVSESEIQDAIMVSSSCSAQVSFRKNDDSLDKAKRIYRRLVESRPVHASPFEHQARAMTEPKALDPKAHNVFLNGEETHVDSQGWRWSGNLRGWVQNRQLLVLTD